MQKIVRRAAFSTLLFAALLAVCPIYGQAQGIDEWVESARVAQSNGNYAEAATAYARATALAPGVAELWSNRGVMEYLAGQLDHSTASLKQALKLNPNLFVPMLFLGKGYVQGDKPALALPYLNHARALKPKDAEVLLALGKANADLNHQRQAAAFYADATLQAPENADAWLGLGSAALEVISSDGRELASTQAQSFWALALYADELFAQGRPLEASDKYKAALAAATPAQKATLARNVQWTLAHPELFPLPANSQEAVQSLNAQLEATKDKAALPTCASAAPHTSSAACAFWAGDYQRSAAQAGKALQQTPQSAENLYWSIKSNERMAVAALARFEELAPQSATNFVMVGDLYRYQRQFDNASSEYAKALAIDAHDPAALLGAASAALSGNKLDDAGTMAQRALADRPLDPQLNLLMAEVLAQKHEYGQMKSYLEKAAAAPPELQHRVHFLLGRAAMEDGNTNEAIKQFELALPGDTDGSIHYQLSRLYRKSGNLAEAQKSEDEAKALIKKRGASAVIAVREATGVTP